MQNVGVFDLLILGGAVVGAVVAFNYNGKIKNSENNLTKVTLEASMMEFLIASLIFVGAGLYDFAPDTPPVNKFTDGFSIYKMYATLLLLTFVVWGYIVIRQQLLINEQYEKLRETPNHPINGVGTQRIFTDLTYANIVFCILSVLGSVIVWIIAVSGLGAPFQQYFLGIYGGCAFLQSCGLSLRISVETQIQNELDDAELAAETVPI